MTGDQSHRPSQLFTIRLWAEALDDDRQEYRGKVQHVVSGEARHFRDWHTLESFLMEKLKTPQPPLQTHLNEETNRGKRTGNTGDERTHRP